MGKRVVSYEFRVVEPHSHLSIPGLARPILKLITINSSRITLVNCCRRLAASPDSQHRLQLLRTRLRHPL
jgi:hypothetical protein